VPTVAKWPRAEWLWACEKKSLRLYCSNNNLPKVSFRDGPNPEKLGQSGPVEQRQKEFGLMIKASRERFNEENP